MYAIYDDIYHQYTPNISIYTIHGSYRVCDFIRLSPVEIHVLTVRNQESTGFIGPPGKSLHGFSRDAKQTTVSSMPPLKLDDIENHALLWIDVVCWFGSKWCLFYNCSLFYIYIYMYIYILYYTQKKYMSKHVHPVFDDKWQMIANHHICRQITICADWIANFGSWKKQVDWIANCGSWNVILRLLFNQFLHCKLTVKLHWTALNPILMVNFWLTVFLDTLQTSPKQTVTSELCQPKGKLHDTPWNPIKTCWIPYVFDGKKTMKKHHVCWSTAPHIAYTVLAMAISYNWLFLWDYTFYKWGCKYL